MAYQKRCECRVYTAVTQRKDQLVPTLKDHQSSTTEPEKHRPEMAVHM